MSLPNRKKISIHYSECYRSGMFTTSGNSPHIGSKRLVLSGAVYGKSRDAVYLLERNCWVEKLWNRTARCPERFRTRAFKVRELGIVWRSLTISANTVNVRITAPLNTKRHMCTTNSSANFHYFWWRLVNRDKLLQGYGYPFT